MGKINPAIQSDLKRLLHRVDACGKDAQALITRGMSKDDLKMAAKRMCGWKLGSHAANIIFAVVLNVWG